MICEDFGSVLWSSLVQDVPAADQERPWFDPEHQLAVKFFFCGHNSVTISHWRVFVSTCCLKNPWLTGKKTITGKKTNCLQTLLHGVDNSLIPWHVLKGRSFY